MAIANRFDDILKRLKQAETSKKVSRWIFVDAAKEIAELRVRLARTQAMLDAHSTHEEREILQLDNAKLRAALKASQRDNMWLRRKIADDVSVRRTGDKVRY